MPTYKAPIENVRFVLNEVFDVGEIAKLPGYEDATPDVIDAVLEGMAQFCEEVIQPINLSGDAEGCKYENGVVRTPKGFKEAYDQYIAGGWMGVTANPEFGGQGLPHTVGAVLEEFVTSANMSFGMYPGLSTGAIRAIEHWAPDAVKQTYLHKMVAGTWSGTMCLTEPHCGTDLGLIRTKAVPDGDGTYKITGTKIFISAGEQDLTENIIHLVLAKLPDAPPGVKGISLFVVPKFLPKDDGSSGARNGVMCGSIEHKMGIKASATCVMNFDDAKGWLIGEPHKGMRAMFTMMNAARFGVAMQGLGIAEVSYQNALAYAKDRIQGRALTGAKDKEKAADPIIVHPDVRKNLLTMKAFTEAARALSVWVGMQLDVIEKHPDPKVRQEADDLLALLTPIIKAYFTDMGSEVANLGVQIFGGHGYIHEHGMEQFVRDARIAQIYEGANGIQALDLVGRKLPQNMGRPLRRFFHPAAAFIEAEMENPALAEFIPHFAKAFGKLQQATAVIAQKGMANPDEAGAASTDYLRMFALVAMAFMWLKMVKVAVAKLPEANGRASFYDSKIKTARFFFQKMLPETETRFRTIMAGAKPLMDLDMEQF